MYEFTPVELASKIIKDLLNRVSEYHGFVANKAVVAVPTRFTQNQRRALEIACDRAGLKDIKKVDESLAAGMSFLIETASLRDKFNFLIFDFGGGTIDITIFQASKETKDGFSKIDVSVKGVWGYRRFGGTYVTDLLHTLIFKKILGDVESDRKKYSDLLSIPHPHPGGDLQLIQGQERDNYYVLSEQAEEAKKQLSSMRTYSVAPRLSCKTRTGTQERTFDLEVSQDELEELVCDHLLKISSEIKTLLKLIDIEPDVLDYVVLAGQSSKMPIVGRILGEEFGEDKIKPLENLKTCVAKGAYWYGKAKTSVVKRVSVSMEGNSSNRTGSSFGIEAIDDLGKSFFLPIIPFGTDIPAKGKINHDVIHIEEDMSEVRLSLYENLSLEDNRITGNDDCEKIEPAFLFSIADDSESAVGDPVSNDNKADKDKPVDVVDDEYYILMNLDENKELKVVLHLDGEDYHGMTYAPERYY